MQMSHNITFLKYQPACSLLLSFTNRHHQNLCYEDALMILISSCSSLFSISLVYSLHPSSLTLGHLHAYHV